MEKKVFEYFFMEWIPEYFLPLAHISMIHLVFPLKKRMSFFISSSKAKNGPYWTLKQFPMLAQGQLEIKSSHLK